MSGSWAAALRVLRIRMRGPGRLLIAGAAVAIIAAVGWFSVPRVVGLHYVGLARQRLARGDYPGAIRSLHKAERFQPSSAEVQYLLAATYRRADQLDRFAEHLEKARALGWPESALDRQVWLAGVQSGDVLGAETQLRRITGEGVPDEVAEEVYEALAKGYLRNFRWRDAWVCLEAWLQWRPDAPHARVMRGYLREQAGDTSAAADEYRAALQQLPTLGEARRRVARLLLQQNQVEEARQEYLARLANAPDDGEALAGLVQCEVRRGDVAAARSAIAQALAAELPPYQRGIVLGELGRLLLGEGKTDEARTVLQQAVALAPGEPQIHAHLATVLARTGQTDQAAYHQQRAQQIRVEYERVTELGRQLVHRPNDPGLRFQTGEILLRQGLREEALRWLASALRCDPHHAPTHALLARFYAEQGDEEQAAYHRLEAARAGAGPQETFQKPTSRAAGAPGAPSAPVEGTIKP